MVINGVISLIDMLTLRIIVPTVPDVVIVRVWPPVLITAYAQVPPDRDRVEVPENKSEFFTLRKVSSAHAFAKPLA